MSTIVELQSEGVTILLVEQNAQVALSLANYGYVLEVGKIVLQNTGQALLVDVRPQGLSRRGLGTAAVGCPVLAWELACEYAGKCSAGQEQAG